MSIGITVLLFATLIYYGGFMKTLTFLWSIVLFGEIVNKKGEWIRIHIGTNPHKISTIDFISLLVLWPITILILRKQEII